jgi:two-component system, OmpR family, sensor histidine kinase KdpD
MVDLNEKRPDPDALLRSIGGSKSAATGKLKIFFGYAAGVGKTYAMLDAARELYRSKHDVLVGYVEPHTRPETMELLEGLPLLPAKIIQYRNIQLREFDLDAALARKPQLILVDELAHTNVEGSRNRKRYQDVEELLNAGIDVFTTVNVQHLESLNDVVQSITKINVHETIPDHVFENADQVELIDIEPDELIKRFCEGKVYLPERAERAMENFFTRENLRLLREIATRKAADRLSQHSQDELDLSEKMASTKLLACISPSPASARCIRWTARTAEALHAPWAAVYVENIESQYLSEVEKRSIRENLELASQLGAETVTLNGNDVAVAITEYARLSGITNIVIGKSRRRKSIKSFFEKDLEDRLISALPSIEVHIIPSLPSDQAPFHRPFAILLRKNLLFSWLDAGKMLLFLVLATLLSLILREFSVGDQNIIMVYILSVLITSITTEGYAVSAVASVLSVMAFNFFFVEPYYTFNANQPGYTITFLIMFMVALIASALTTRLQAQARLAVLRERRTEVLYEINKKLLVTRGLDNIIALVNNDMSKLFDRSVIFYPQDPSDQAGVLLQSSADPDASFMLSASERAVANWSFDNQKHAGAGTDTLMGAGAMYVPVVSQGRSLGVIGLSCARGLFSQTNRTFLQMITSQVAMALERQLLSDEHRQVLVDAAREKMRSTLLRAISHDLRSPLASIFGSSSMIIDGGVDFDRSSLIKLVTIIREDSQWLLRMVENILSVTRLEEGSMSIHKVPELVEEIIDEALSRIHTRYPDRKITTQVTESPLAVPLDRILIEQVLINLLDNAVKHSDEQSIIQIRVHKKEDEIEFEVIDNGEGIDECAIQNLLEGFQDDQCAVGSSRSAGIGLSICMSIVRAHNGRMEAANHENGGAVFRFFLPLR